MVRHRRWDVLLLVLLALPPLLMFWPQTLGGRTLIPTENLYQYEPYAPYREVVRAPSVPHNALVSDLVLQNYQWKLFTRASFAQGEFPLWNPHQFGGVAFFAAGQAAVLYPFSVLYYVLDLPSAYGWFTVVQLWLAGACMYLFARGIGRGRAGAWIAGAVYQLSGFFVISAVFPMIISAAAWLPLLLLMVECVIARRAWRGRASALPWVVIGAAALGCVVLAGHVEITYYTLLIMAYYAAGRLLWQLGRPAVAPAIADTWRARLRHNLPSTVVSAAWLLAMVVLGMGVGAVQFIPTLEVAGGNFRADRSSFAQVLGWAHPARDVVQFIMPNFYGNPTHHSYFDWFSGQTVDLRGGILNAQGNSITAVDWGIKNYVEGALYVGVVPLCLVLLAVLSMRRTHDGPPHRLLLLILLGAALSFMFGTPTYALLYYGLPGINQLHSPFRWVFAVTLCVAALSAFGVDALLRAEAGRLRRVVAWGLLAGGVAVLGGLAFSYVLYPQIEPLLTRAVLALARAPEAFSDARMFYNYQFTNVLALGVVLLTGGAAVWALDAVQRQPRTLAACSALLAGLIVADLWIASWGFNPASDRALLDFTPPSVAWLQTQAQWDPTCRYTTLEDPAQRRILQANATTRYALNDVRGYESIIPKQYAQYMAQLAPQHDLQYNRIAPLYTSDDWQTAVQSPRLDALNVCFIISHKTIDVPSWLLAYEDEAVRIWRNKRHTALIAPYSETGGVFTMSPLAVTSNTGRALTFDVLPDLGQDVGAVVVSISYAEGWRAFISTADNIAGNVPASEQALTITRHNDNFMRVDLPPNAQGSTVRLVYSPLSVQVGALVSALSGAVVLLLVGVYVWRGGGPQAEGDGAGRVARNSVTPILLNLFNRGIDMAFAIVMLRLLGAADAGLYYYLGAIFMWFDIFTNFGLNLWLVRQASRERAQAAVHFFRTSGLRLVLLLVGVPLLGAFLWARQTFSAAPLPADALLAIGLLYVGLLPSTLSTGLTALFYAFERAEYPAAVQTITTLNKTVLGLAALLLGWGYVGLAGVSIVTNVITLGLLAWGARAYWLQRSAPQGDTATAPLAWRPLWRGMIGESFPLMLNHFLATIFFQIDVVILQPYHGDRVVGQYSTAYKWLQAINVIPSFFTQALMPLLSRQVGDGDMPAFRRTYHLAVKLLIALALPAAVVFTFAAVPLTALLGGAEYLPNGAIALQIMIWSIPLGWINSLTQYALIALNLQQRITRAFIVAVAFNISSNLLLIPSFSFVAAAYTTIASEAVLLLMFGWMVQRAVGGVAWLELAWRPLLAAGAMAAVTAALWGLQPLLALAAGGAVYAVVVLALRPFTAEEWGRMAPLLPARVRVRLAWLGGG
jgi:O-antigen/teichoic acid export membrane protein